jgi:hypothetical protein
LTATESGIAKSFIDSMLRESMVPAFVRCGAAVQSLDIDIALPVRELKPFLSSSLGLSPAIALLYRGDILRADAHLSSASFAAYDTLVVSPLPPVLSLTVLSGEVALALDVDVLSSISNLRTSIACSLSLRQDEFRLVSNGQVLCDEFSVCYYDILNHSIVRVVPVKPPAHEKVRPLALVDALQVRINEYRMARGLRQAEIATELSDILNNPVLQSYARINHSAKEVIDDALSIIELSQSPSVSKTDFLMAAMSDIMLNQTEFTREGLPLLSRGDSRAESLTRVDLIARLDYEPSISETPLPICWAHERERLHLDPRRLPMKDLFAKQVRVLKRMGFADEAAIQMALRETAGNVNRAAKFLMRTGNRRA